MSYRENTNGDGTINNHSKDTETANKSRIDIPEFNHTLNIPAVENLKTKKSNSSENSNFLSKLLLPRILIGLDKYMICVSPSNVLLSHYDYPEYFTVSFPTLFLER